MNRFKDNAGREWAVAIHVHAVEQVEARCGVKIAGLFRDGLAGLLELSADPVKFVRALWVLVEDQAEKFGVKPEQFGRALGGDALEASFEAFVHALADFSPSRLRPAIRTLAAKTTPDARPSTSSNSATNSGASSESIPAG
ncbi:Uncharacterized protein OS=Isosphaera pallida (strain ATCC 43644 / DSM 9630 / IS1B) GN=Isop_2427 PE=4 SV=1 [Gemmata massiliana]|uniref:Uncharacterized protein n=1 Tax=Gemmata massiliana TaxID=1210884 RepID=A0A6P2D6F6_9BACT|nr:hypothetical protein [Gemmata massiliana]VTR96045.1 Uncharacterized protein OS=Isosphaera pallida (strain ATCC 43644 / DSM 9630 / IS1B) GN=Isop_2427 PE=4 SV=1 [Gemmata massiliana]